MSAPLAGHNLVRLVYLDESGVDRAAPYFCVAGVLIHGDRDWPEVDRRISALIEKYVLPQHRVGFYFHATDIFHGSKYYRGTAWPRDKRIALLNELADIIDELHLPVVFGQYNKERFASLAEFTDEDDLKRRERLIHLVSVIDCLQRADSWVSRYAQHELATVIHEDGVRAKALIKYAVRIARDPARIAVEFSEDDPPGLPLKRIIDTVHFAEKADARPLQLADLCAFIIGRGLGDREVPQHALDIIYRHLNWIIRDEASASGQADA